MRVIGHDLDDAGPIDAHGLGIRRAVAAVRSISAEPQRSAQASLAALIPHVAVQVTLCARRTPMPAARQAVTRDLPRLLTIEEVADHLGVNVRHVRRLVAERRIPTLREVGAACFALTLLRSTPGVPMPELLPPGVLADLRCFVTGNQMHGWCDAAPWHDTATSRPGLDVLRRAPAV